VIGDTQQSPAFFPMPRPPHASGLNRDEVEALKPQAKLGNQADYEPADLGGGRLATAR
jgi:hypothetical protein